MYLSVSLANTPSWLWYLHDLVLSHLSFEPASDRRKTNKGWGCVGKDVDTKLSIQYIKNNLKKLKEIALFIILQLYILESITLLNYQCNVFRPHISYYNSCFFLKKDCNNRNNCGIRLHDADLECSLMKEKKRCPYVLDLIFMFWHFRFSFRNLKDANSCTFSWCITTSSLLICFWSDMTLSQFVQYLQ